MFDHLVVHTADVEGPLGLHPDLPSRGGDLLVRRHLVDQGMQLLLHTDLVTAIDGDERLRYLACEESASFVDLLDAPYAGALKQRPVAGRAVRRSSRGGDPFGGP